MHDIHISIVSHHQLHMVQDLLQDLNKQDCADRLSVFITVNVHENILINSENLYFPIHMIHNDHPRGFSENHNAAFKYRANSNERQFFLVINPDVRLHKNVISQLIRPLKENKIVGLVAPIVFGANNVLEDSARELPTPSRVLAKIFGRQGIWKNEKHYQPDWVAGMFMAFRADVFHNIGGFNENYFLYYEDVDICCRLWLKGYTIQVNKNVSIFHHAQRSSRHNLKYFVWHISSMFRFFSSDTYRKIKIFHRQRNNCN